MKQNDLSLRSRGKSFRFAFNGISVFFKQEPNAILHIIATILVFVAAIFFDITKTEWIAIIVVTGFVWVAELLNTAIEKIMDFIQPAYHPSVKYIKDVSAAAVLLSAITAILTGAIIFIPKIL